MTPQVKQRIEQIKAGQVPDGYKKTKIGIVPTEWNNTCFSDLFVSKSKYTEDLEKYPLYSLTIEDGVTAKSERYERSHLVKKKNAYKIVEPDDFTYNPMNVRFGAVARHKGNIPVCVSGYYDIFTTTQKRDLKFMDSFLVSNMMIKYYNKVSTGSLVEKQRVHFSEFIEFDLPIPCPEEREKIAKILSVQDKVIELKEKLLVEKRKQKKYLMQQLLTGKKRLPGFEKDWKKQKMSDILCERNEENKDQSLRICSVAVATGVVDQMEHLGKSMAAANTSNYNVVHHGDVVYTKSPTGSFPFGIVKQSQLKEKVAVSPLYGVYEPKSYELGYLLNEYFMYSNNTNGYLLPIVNKGAKNTINISNQTFIKPSLFLPVDEAEIAALVKIFKVANLEIDIISKELEQEKQKKKALMQLLLTGIVRVDK